MAESKFDRPQEQPLFMLLSKKDPELVESIVEAQRTLLHFRVLIKDIGSRDNVPLVKAYFSEGTGIWLWLIVREVRETAFEAETFEAPPELPTLKAGTRRWIPNAEITDWMIIAGGTLHGGYSLRLQRRRLPESERASFDRYVGAQSYAPLPS